MANFDMILEKIQPFGRYQVVYWLIASVALIPAGMQNVMNVYLMATPDNWCHVPELANQSVELQRRITAPSGESNKDAGCRIRNLNYSDLDLNDSVSYDVDTIPCARWDYDLSLYGNTGVSKWNLVCSRSSWAAVAQSIYMVGVMIGAIVFSYISDRFGRKVCVYSGLLSVIGFGVASSFITDFWLHTLVRMVVGMSTSGNFLGAFVLYMELIGISKRVGPGVAAQAFFAFGYMILAGVAFWTRDLVWTNFAMSIIPLVLVSYWWILPESPRWLLTQGRLEEAKDELRRAVKMNGVDVDVDELVNQALNLDTKEDVVCSERKYSMLDLLRTPNIRIRTIANSYIWFVTSMVYYGLSLGVTELAGDPYLNLFFSGCSELASVVVMYFTMDRIGRRIPLLFVLVIGGIGCGISALLPAEYYIASIVLSNIGKFGVSGSFAVIYVYTAELFPTVIRTNAVGAGSTSARVGAFLAPFIQELRHVWTPLPGLVFGVLSVAAGLLSLIFPETLGQKLPDTMEEGESFQNKKKVVAASC